MITKKINLSAIQMRIKELDESIARLHSAMYSQEDNNDYKVGYAKSAVVSLVADITTLAKCTNNVL